MEHRVSIRMERPNVEDILNYGKDVEKEGNNVGMAQQKFAPD